MDVEMAEPKTVEHGNKEKDVRTDAAKPDVEKNAKEKGDAENAENAAGFNSQVKESTEFPLPSSSLSDSIEADISSLMDIHIEQETPQIQSPLVQKVPVSVIPENANLPPIPEILTETLVSTTISPPHVTPTISTVPQQTIAPILTSPIITESPTITTAIPESNALTAVQLRVSKLEKDVSELKNIDHSAKTIPTLKVADTVKDHKRKHDDDDDEDPPAGLNQGKAPSKGSKTGKSASAKELVEEPIAEVVMDDAINTARSQLMVELMDKQMRERRIIRNLD
ncbi:hypothetical protein Tco_1228949 [Tanacetum coccineum]